MQATAQCGVPLQALEDEARKLGLTTGHSPQSKPVAHMGGLVATRSIGQFSTLYGGIEDMVVGLEAVFPGGDVARIKNVPRRAAGPDIRHVVIGNEGALCFITEVTVKLFPYLPENNTYLGWTLKSMKTGLRGAARGDGGRLQAVGRAPLRPRRRRHPLLPLRGRGRLRPPLHGRGHGRDRAGDGGGDRRDRGPPSRARSRSTASSSGRGSRTSRGGRTRSRPRTSASARRTTSTARRRSRPAGARSTTSTRPPIAADPERDPGPHDPRRPLVPQLHQRDEHVLQLLLRPRRLRRPRRR